MCVLLVTFELNGSSVCSATNQQSAEESIATKKTLTILDGVVGLDTAAYNVNIASYSQDLYFEVLPQEYLKYTLESDESKLSIVCSFVDEKLRSMNMYVTDGSPRMTQQVSNTHEIAKDFLDKYQTYSSASYYSTLRSMLDNVEADKNVTKTSENVNLKVTITSNCTSFRWTYTVNGIEAPSKCVALKFEQGFLKYFIDTWSLWTIGSTDLNISEDEAIKIAMNAAENYSWNVSMGEDNPEITVTDFNIVGISETTLQISNYATQNKSRGGDPLTLYPGWHVKLYFDKLYSGQVYGLDIGIWADTGEINAISTLLLLGDYPSNVDVGGNGDSVRLESNEENNNATILNISLLVWIALPMTILLGATIVYSKRKKQCSDEKQNRPQSNALKLGGTLLCLLMLFTMVPMAITLPTVNASTYVMPLYGSSFNITVAEGSAAHSVINVWESYFNTWTDYTIYDYYGSDTQKQTILDNADDFEANYDHVAMFHYGHGGMNGVHRDYFDDDGWDYFSDQIWDYEVWDETGSSKHFFVVIWACRQGDYIGGYSYLWGRYGMPYCWFHGNPSSGDCFIGFEDASMPITQKSANNTNYDHELWLKQVGIRLSYSHSTVIQALDAASNQYFNCDFVETELYLGFTAKWGEDPDQWGPGQMKVYGNWNIQVY